MRDFFFFWKILTTYTDGKHTQRTCLIIFISLNGLSDQEHGSLTYLYLYIHWEGIAYTSSESEAAVHRLFFFLKKESNMLFITVGLTPTDNNALPVILPTRCAMHVVCQSSQVKGDSSKTLN